MELLQVERCCLLKVSDSLFDRLALRLPSRFRMEGDETSRNSRPQPLVPDSTGRIKKSRATRSGSQGQPAPVSVRPNGSMPGMSKACPSR